MLNKTKTYLTKWWNKWKNRKNKHIQNFRINLTKSIAIQPCAKILDMNGNVKQEGYMLVQHKRCSKFKDEMLPLMWDDTPEALIERIKPSLA